MAVRSRRRGGFDVTAKSARSKLAGRRTGEQGQVLVLVILFLVVLLGMAAMVVDVGYAYYAHRSLQASADAAALAGAQELPDGARAIELAKEYGGEPGKKNYRDNIPNVTTNVTTKCISSVPGCNPVNAVVVTERAARVPTIFAKVLGIDNFTINVKSTACSPCGVKPLDIMLVLDRTGSMCQDHWGNFDPSCTDLNNARDGMKEFMKNFDAEIQWIGLGVLPPATSVGNRCTTPQSSNYNSRTAAYTIVPLSKDYAKNGVLNQNSNLVQTINCMKGNGTTSYANAIEAAQGELDRGGRPDIQDVVVFLSDGAANTGPTYYPTSSPYRRQPCHQGIWSSSGLKSRGTIVYSIGYDLDALNGGANKCQSYTGADELPRITAYETLQQIATSSEHFFNKPDPGQLKTIFDKIAADISRGSSALIDNDYQ
jgi:Putative Flp pilus-assembly TadE/G-like/von Willebrand factor type A domain